MVIVVEVLAGSWKLEEIFAAARASRHRSRHGRLENEAPIQNQDRQHCGSADLPSKSVELAFELHCPRRKARSCPTSTPLIGHIICFISFDIGPILPRIFLVAHLVLVLLGGGASIDRQATNSIRHSHFEHLHLHHHLRALLC